MAATLSTPKVTALASIRDHGHYGPAKTNTVTALETAKLFYIEPNRHGGFDKLHLTTGGREALAAAETKAAAKAAKAVTAPEVAPVTSLAEQTPVKIDTRAAELDARYGRLVALRTVTADRLQRFAGQRPLSSTRSGHKTWALDTADAVARVRRALAVNAIASWDIPIAVEALAQLAALDAELTANRAEAAAIDVEYDRRPWSRFVGVSGGHIHSGIWCAGGSIQPTTVRTWAPELSGLSVAEAVEKLGPRLCTHCFPSAPVEWTRGVDKADDSCSGSGRSEVHGTYHRGSPGWGTCQGCGTTQTMTPRGLVRKHKRAK